MKRFDNAYSRFVALAKVILPLASLALLTTLFLFSRGGDQELSIPYAQVEIEALAREQRLDKPTFATVMNDGSELMLSAQKVRPNVSDRDVINSDNVNGTLNLADGSSVSMTASDFVLDGPSRIAELSGDVEITTSSGYEISTEHLATLLNESQLIAPYHVKATGPVGEISANSMELSYDEANENYLLVFNGGVKLIYQPGN